jgi:hypothetical protein
MYHTRLARANSERMPMMIAIMMIIVCEEEGLLVWSMKLFRSIVVLTAIGVVCVGRKSWVAVARCYGPYIVCCLLFVSGCGINSGEVRRRFILVIIYLG